MAQQTPTMKSHTLTLVMFSKNGTIYDAKKINIKMTPNESTLPSKKNKTLPPRITRAKPPKKNEMMLKDVSTHLMSELWLRNSRINSIRMKKFSTIFAPVVTLTQALDGRISLKNMLKTA